MVHVLALLVACSGEKTYYAPPVDSGDTASESGGDDTADGVPAPLTFADYVPPRSAVWGRPPRTARDSMRGAPTSCRRS